MSRRSIANQISHLFEMNFRVISPILSFFAGVQLKVAKFCFMETNKLIQRASKTTNQLLHAAVSNNMNRE